MYYYLNATFQPQQTQQPPQAYPQTGASTSSSAPQMPSPQPAFGYNAPPVSYHLSPLSSNLFLLLSYPSASTATTSTAALCVRLPTTTSTIILRLLATTTAARIPSNASGISSIPTATTTAATSKTSCQASAQGKY